MSEATERCPECNSRDTDVKDVTLVEFKCVYLECKDCGYQVSFYTERMDGL